MNQIYKVIWSRVKHCYVVFRKSPDAAEKTEERLLKRRACLSVRFCVLLFLQDA